MRSWREMRLSVCCAACCVSCAGWPRCVGVPLGSSALHWGAVLVVVGYCVRYCWWRMLAFPCGLPVSAPALLFLLCLCSVGGGLTRRTHTDFLPSRITGLCALGSSGSCGCWLISVFCISREFYFDPGLLARFGPAEPQRRADYSGVRLAS